MHALGTSATLNTLKWATWLHSVGIWYTILLQIGHIV